MYKSVAINCRICDRQLYSNRRSRERDPFYADVCAWCTPDYIRRAKQIVKQARRRKGGVLTPDLTSEQWLGALQYFNGKCAYCQKKEYHDLEHFVPMSLGGSTTISNVVPSCISCGNRKRNTHPALVKNMPKEDIERVRDYLLSLA